MTKFGVGDNLSGIRVLKTYHIHPYFQNASVLPIENIKQPQKSQISDSTENSEKIPPHRSLTLDQVLQPSEC